MLYEYVFIRIKCESRYSSVGISACYGLDGRGVESLWGGGRIICTCPDRPWSQPSLLYNWYLVIPQEEGSQGVWR